MIDLEKYNNGNDTYTSPRNGNTYKSLKAFRSHWNYNSDHFNAVKLLPVNKRTCSHCDEKFYVSGIKAHERGCYLNPDNIRLCEVCESPIKNYKHSKGTCSHSCSNIHYARKRRPDENSTYTTICFRHHEKKCIVCGEGKIVAVHHNDKNHDNKDPENLIPLCPTHHQYVHSRFKDEVQPIIDEYIKQRIIGV